MRRLITAFAFFLSCPTLLFAQAPGPATGFVVDYTGTTPSVIKLNWVAPSPATNLTSYLILASDVGFGSITDPTNGFTVSNLTNLSGGSGAFNAGLVLTYNGFTGITAGKQYFFKIYAYNNAGAGPPTYAAAATATGFAEPAQATNIVFSNRQATTLTVNWTNGGSAGASRIVVGRATSAVTFTPSDGTPLTGASGTPSTDFTDAVNGDLGGNRLLFSGSGSGPINITNLSAGVTYYFVVLEFSGSGTLINYNIATATGNPANRTTLPAQPTSEVTGVTLTSNAVGAAAITWSVNGNGANRIIVGKKNTIDGTPSDETTYTSNASFGSGTQIGTGNYVVYNNNSPNNRTVTNLQNGTYQFQFFEYNGTGGNENYLVPATNTYTVATEPSAQPTLPVVSNFLNDGTGYDVSWTAVPNTPNPTVDGYIVIRKQGSAPGTDPTDGTTYNVNDVIVAGETVEYVGSATLFSDAGLTAGTQYFYNIYSYNGTGTNINYRQAGSPLSVNRFTLPAEPSAQSAGAMASASQTSSQIRDITFPAATGTPSGYLVVRKSGSNYGTLPTPVDGDLPTVGSTLGEGVVVWNGALPTSNNFDDTSGLLGAQTQYYAVFSYNQAGSGGAASYNFLSTSPLTGNFTTDCTEPTVQPGAMTFSGTSTTSTNVNFTRGNGTGGVIIMAKQGSAPNPPSQGNTYSAGVNNDFSLATDIGGGTKVVYRGVASGASTATSRPVSGLLPNTQYFFAAYEYNSTLSCYNLISPSANDVTTLGFVTVVTNTTSNATGSLNSSSTNNVLLGFSATTAGNTTNLTGITITTSTTVTSKFTRLGIWESSDNTFGSDTEIGFVNNPTGTTIAFSGLSSALSGTTKYYFIVANIGPYVTSSTAAVQVTFSPTTGGNMTFSSANTPAGADVVGTNYSFVDVTPPVINSVARSNGNVFLGGLTQIITVTYDEPMNSGTSPTITFSPSTNFTPSVGAWSGGNTIWTQTFTHTGASETVPTETVTALGASDVSGNANVVSNNNTFAIDTKKPQATVTISTDPITISSNTQTVTVTYDEPMNTGSTPTITFVPANGNFTAPAGSWNGPGTQFTRTFTHNPTQETVVGQTVSVANTSGATDIAGNADLGATSPGFLIDTKPPKLTNISSANLNATYTTGAVIAIDVTFDEIVNVTATPTLTLNAGGGATASYVSGTGTTILTFNYTVGAIGSGQNTTDLNVTAIAGTIQDQRLNNFDNTLPGSANLANNKDIAIDTQRPTVLTVRSTTASGFYNAGKIINIAMTFDEPVNITGFPVLALNTTPAANATYFSGSGTTVITFRYTVGATENSAYLDYVNTSSLSLAGGAIKDLVAIDATLTLPGLGANSIFPNRDVVIDTTPPVLSSVLPVDDKFAVPLGGNLTINLNDANTNIQKNTLTGTAFRLKRISDNAVIGNIDATSSAISVSGGQAVINLAAASVVPVAGEAYYVEIDNGALLDIAGNPYAGFMNNSSWNFQMYSVPSLTGTSDIVGTKACVGQNITVNGKYFSGYNTLQGIASVTFYDNAGGNATVTSSGITVINDTQLSVLVPPTATINTQTKIKITSKNEGPIPGLGSNVGGISANFSQLVDLGPTSAQMSLSTLGAFEVCDNGSIISRNVKVTVTGGNNSSIYGLVYSITGSIAQPNQSIGSYANGSDIIANPPGVGDYSYAIVSVTDGFGCISPSNTIAGGGLTPTIREFTANSTTLVSSIQSIPVCLANTPNSYIDLTVKIDGSSVSGVFGLGNGQGSFTGGTTITGSAPTTPPTNQTFTTTKRYNFNVQDYTLSPPTPLTLTLTSTGSNPVCQESQLQIPITFSTSATAIISPTITPAVVCQSSGATVTLTGTVTGGATTGIWQAFDQSGSPVNITTSSGGGSFSGGSGSFIASVPGLGNNGPGYSTVPTGAGIVTATYTFRAADYGAPNNGNVTFKLIPNGGTCGTSTISPSFTVTANPIPAPVPGINPTNVCVGDQKFYSVVNTLNSTYQWSITPSTFGSISAGQNTSTVLINWYGVTWNSTSAYVAGDVINFNGVLFKSKTSIAPSVNTPVEGSNWQQITWNNWAASVPYNFNELVYQGGAWYLSTVNNNTSTPPGAGWTNIGAKTFALNDIVFYQNQWWQSTSNGNSNVPGGANWALIINPSISVIETNQAGCASSPTNIPGVALNVSPSLYFKQPSERLFGNSINFVELVGSAYVSSMPVAGDTTFTGVGVIRNGARLKWLFSPQSAGPGVFNVSFRYPITSTQCETTITDQFTVFAAGSGFVLYPGGTPVLPEYCSDTPIIKLQLSPSFVNRIIDPITGIKRDIEDFVLVDNAGNSITNIQDTSVPGVITSTGSDGSKIVTYLGTSGSPIYRTNSYVEFYPSSVPTPVVTTITVAARYRDSGGTLKTLTTQIITLNPVPILTPVVAGVNNTAFCSNVNAIDLRTNNSSTITDFSFGLAQPDITTSNPNDVVPAPDPNNIVRPHPSLNDRFQLVPQNSLPLWSGTDFNPKDRLLYYAYQDAKGCNDTTALSGPGSLQVRLNHQPPAPTITGGADICVVNGTPPTSAVISDALSSTDPVAPNPVTSNLFAWFNNSALTGSPVSNNRSFTPGLDPTVNQTVALFAVQTINNCQSPTTNVRYLVLNAPQFTWNKFFIDATPVNFSVDLGGLQSFISKIDWSIKNRTGATVSNQTVNNPAQVSSIGFSPSNPDVYATTMTITSLPTQGSCSANKSNNVVIVGSTTANASTTYDSKFANSDGGWLPVGQNVSWEFGSPGGAKSILGSTNVWITKLSGAYNNNEFSYLYTPYFDITGLTRPLISFKSWIDLDIDDGSGNKSSTGDGVVLQYSTDSKVIGDPTKIWKNLGTLGSGVDWFNKAFLTSNPAAINGANNTDNPNVGWGGSILTDGKVDWLTPKFVLDNPRKEGTNVVFRFAFASGTASLTGSQRKGFGFAIDSVRIGNRTRTILYENFTNKGSNGAVEKFESDYVRNNLNSGGIGTQVVKLNYHVDFPAPDPFNQDNPADPSSRALYYGVNSTPASRLDGSDGPNSATTPNEPFSKWGIQRYNIRTLQLGQAFITIKPATGNSITANGKISVSVDIRPTVDLPPNTVLHIAVVEQSIPLNSLSAGKQKMIATGENQFDFVVKKMIPSAAGTITGALKQAVTKTFGPFEWVPDPIKLYPPNTKNLAVIAFLQNEKSGVIYQAEIVSDLDDPATNVITGLEPIPSEQIVVFPNPANKEFTILLPGELSRGASVRLIDQVGKTAVTSSLPERSKSKTINTQDLSPGMYILQIETGPGAVTRKKVMVVHED